MGGNHQKILESSKTLSKYSQYRFFYTSKFTSLLSRLAVRTIKIIGDDTRWLKHEDTYDKQYKALTDKEKVEMSKMILIAKHLTN